MTDTYERLLYEFKYLNLTNHSYCVLMEKKHFERKRLDSHANMVTYLTQVLIIPAVLIQDLKNITLLMCHQFWYRYT